LNTGQTEDNINRLAVPTKLSFTRANQLLEPDAARMVTFAEDAKDNERQAHNHNESQTVALERPENSLGSAEQWFSWVKTGQQIANWVHESFACSMIGGNGWHCLPRIS